MLPYRPGPLRRLAPARCPSDCDSEDDGEAPRQPPGEVFWHRWLAFPTSPPPPMAMHGNAHLLRSQRFGDGEGGRAGGREGLGRLGGSDALPPEGQPVWYHQVWNWFSGHRSFLGPGMRSSSPFSTAPPRVWAPPPCPTVQEGKFLWHFRCKRKIFDQKWPLGRNGKVGGGQEGTGPTHQDGRGSTRQPPPIPLTR